MMRAIMKQEAKIDQLNNKIFNLEARLATMETLYYTSLDVNPTDNDYGIMDWLTSEEDSLSDEAATYPVLFYPEPTAPPLEEDHVYEELPLPNLNVLPDPGAGGALQ